MYTVNLRDCRSPLCILQTQHLVRGAVHSRKLNLLSLVVLIFSTFLYRGIFSKKNCKFVLKKENKINKKCYCRPLPSSASTEATAAEVAAEEEVQAAQQLSTVTESSPGQVEESQSAAEVDDAQAVSTAAYHYLYTVAACCAKAAWKPSHAPAKVAKYRCCYAQSNCNNFRNTSLPPKVTYIRQ